MPTLPDRFRTLACVVLTILPIATHAQPNLNYATPYAITTLAGTTSSGHDDGLHARFSRPTDVAVDAAGNIYIADTGNHTIRKRTPDGRVSTLAGTASEAGSADGNGAAARFYQPSGVAVDLAGNVYVADRNNHVIRKISPVGNVTTFAGSATNRGSADGTGSAARFNSPLGVAVDTVGNVYVADTGNYTIRKITPAGNVSTLAGSPGQWGATNGTGAAARFYNPEGIAVDSIGNLYVAEPLAQYIRKISPAGETSVFAGVENAPGHVDGIGTAARLSYPSDVAVDAAGNLIVSCRSRTVRKVSPNGTITTLAGASDVNGSSDGPGASARFSLLQGIALDGAGNAYVADSENNTIRRIAPDTTVSTIAGVSEVNSQGHVDATGQDARFSILTDIAVDTSGNLYVADPGNHCVRKITPIGGVTTLAGSPFSIGSTDGVGATATFGRPTGIAIDAAGNLYVTDADFHVIRKITPTGTVTTLAGGVGQPALVDGIGSAARFNSPTGVSVDAAGHVYVLDRQNNAVRKISPTGVVSTVITRASVIDHTWILFHPTNLEVDQSGNIFICDTVSHTIRKVSPQGAISIVAGTGQINGFNDGTGTGAAFTDPTGVATNGNGDVYVADYTNGLVRHITPAGVVTTLAGSLFIGSRQDGVGSSSGFDAPYGITTDAAGNIYVTDSGSVRKGRLATAPVIVTPPQSQSVTAGGSVQFSVTASGAPDPTYQWFLNGSPFTGATASTLSFSNARSSDAGDYTVAITNALGSVTSTKATLTVKTVASPPATGSGGTSSGGGGAPSLWFAVTLLLLGTMRRWSLLKTRETRSKPA